MFFSVLVKCRHACRYTEGVMTFLCLYVCMFVCLYVCIHVCLYGSELVVGDFKREILLSFTPKFVKML